MSITRSVARRQQQAADREALLEARTKPAEARTEDDHHYLRQIWLRRHQQNLSRNSQRTHQ